MAPTSDDDALARLTGATPVTERTAPAPVSQLSADRRDDAAMAALTGGVAAGTPGASPPPRPPGEDPPLANVATVPTAPLAAMMRQGGLATRRGLMRPRLGTNVLSLSDTQADHDAAMLATLLEDRPTTPAARPAAKPSGQGVGTPQRQHQRAQELQQHQDWYDDDRLDDLLQSGPVRATEAIGGTHWLANRPRAWDHPDDARRKDDAILSSFFSPKKLLDSFDDDPLSDVLKRMDDEALAALVGSEMGKRLGPKIRAFPVPKLAPPVHLEVVAGGFGKGAELNQLFRPLGIAVGAGSSSMLIADNGNRRVMHWFQGKMEGEVVVQDRGLDVLDVAFANGYALVSRSGGIERWEAFAAKGELVVSAIWAGGIAFSGTTGELFFADVLDHCVRTWPLRDQSSALLTDTELSWSRGIHHCGAGIVAGRSRGDQVDELCSPFGIAVDSRSGALFIADAGNHRVMRWSRGSRQGVVVAGGHGAGRRLDQLRHPRGVAYDPVSGSIYVADTGNHRVVRWPRGASKGEVVAGGMGKGRGHRLAQLNTPSSVVLDAHGRLLVADTGNHRVVRATFTWVA